MGKKVIVRLISKDTVNVREGMAICDWRHK